MVLVSHTITIIGLSTYTEGLCLPYATFTNINTDTDTEGLGGHQKIYFFVLGWGKGEINMHLSLFYIQLYNKKILKVKILNIFLSSQIRDLSHILTEEVVFTA